MGTRTIWLACLAALGIALLPPAAVRAQDVGPADPQLPFPLWHNRPESGGFFTAVEFAIYRQTNPLKDQPLAIRGFVDVDGSISGQPGRFIGSGDVALSAGQVGGPTDFQPGFKLTAGWTFEDGSSLQLSWMHLLKAEYGAAATLIPPGFQGGVQLQDTFLFAPFYNFPIEYGGPLLDVGQGNPGATFGIWNAADDMSLEFTQRTEMFDLTYRVPIFALDQGTDCGYRCYGLVGPRFFWVWERFKWRTVDRDILGFADPRDVAIYTNIVSNRMYGAHVGLGHEYYLGNGFAFSVDGEVSAYIDVVKERAKIEFGEKFQAPQAKRARTVYNLVPGAELHFNVWWYPTEGIQFRAGYNVMAFLNTIGFQNPVDFNYGRLTPEWEGIARVFDGMQIGVSFIW